MAAHAGLRELSLFSGAGGGLLATQHLLGWRAVCYVERDPYCVKVLKARIRDGLLHEAPIWDDCRTFDGHPWRGLVDVISAGFPCQPFSVAGARKADADERNGWPWTLRVLREVGPRYVFLENVPGLLAPSHGYFGTVLGDLAALGYDARWTCLSASQLGAPHRRDRLWIVATLADAERELVRRGESGRGHGKSREAAPESRAHGAEPHLADADGERQLQQSRLEFKERGRPGDRREQGRDVADAAGQERPGLPGRAQAKHAEFRSPGEQGGGSSWWAAESCLGRVAHGVAARVDRLRALGNGQVPAVAAAAWRLLT